MNKLKKFLRTQIDLFAIFAVFISALTFYITAIDGEFVFDDLPLISSDPFFHQDSTATIADCFKRTYWRKRFMPTDGHYRPLTFVTYLLNSRYLGFNSPSFRLVNILINAFLCSMLYFLFLKISKNRLIAFLAAILFAVHPLHSEAVIPASGRSDLLCSLFLCAGFLSHICEFRMKYFFIFLFGLCAILCKEFGVVLLPLCITYDLFFRHCEFRKTISFKELTMILPYLACVLSVVIYFWMRIALISEPFPRFTKEIYWSDNHLGFLNFWERLPTALWLQGFAIGKFLLPLHLSHDYSYAQILPINSFSDSRVFELLSFIIALALIFYLLLRENRKITIFCLCAYFLSVLPVANIFTPTGTIFGERLYFFSSAFLCLGLINEAGYLITKFKTSNFAVISLGLIIFSALFIRLSFRIADWQNLYSIAEAGIRTAPKSFKTWNNYALQLYDMGRFEEAEQGFTRSLEINPSNFQALRNRANARIRIGKNSEALEDLKRCIEIGTRDTDVYNKAGALYAMFGNSDEAIRLWNISLQMNPKQKRIINALEDLKNEVQNERSNK